MTCDRFETSNRTLVVPEDKTIPQRHAVRSRNPELVVCQTSPDRGEKLLDLHLLGLVGVAQEQCAGPLQLKPSKKRPEPKDGVDQGGT